MVSDVWGVEVMGDPIESRAGTSGGVKERTVYAYAVRDYTYGVRAWQPICDYRHSPMTTTEREPLSRARVLQAAIDLADRDGMRALSMRNLAKELGFEVMSLYNHVANKGDLLDGMIDQVVGGIELPGREVDWRAAIKTNTLAMHELFQHHKWAAALAASRLPGTNRIEFMEWQLATIARSGLDEEVAHHAFHAINNHLLGYSLAADAMPDADDAEHLITEFMQRLDADDHAHMIHHIHQHMEPEESPGTSFEFVLDLMLDGLERTI